MARTLLFTVLITIPSFAIFIFLVILVIRVLLKYIRSTDVRREKHSANV